MTKTWYIQCIVYVGFMSKTVYLNKRPTKLCQWLPSFSETLFPQEGGGDAGSWNCPWRTDRRDTVMTADELGEVAVCAVDHCVSE